MEPIKIMPCLDMKDGRVVKGINFINLRDAGDPVENARKLVSQHINWALRRIEKYHKPLHKHLVAAIRKGTICTYNPSTPIPWQFM